MEPTEEELRQRYESLDTSELVDLYRTSELTERALVVLRAVLQSRGVGDEDFQELVAEEDAGEIDDTIRSASTPLPKLWIGYGIAIVFFLYGLAKIIIDPTVEEPVSLDLALIGLAGWGYWLFCVYRIHWVLAEATNNNYPISPGKGAAFNLIPLFNLYWFFKWPNEIATFLNRQSGTTTMPLGGPGFFILVGFLLTRIDTSLGLLIIFSVLVWITRSIRQVVDFSSRTIPTTRKDGVSRGKEARQS